jgi:4-amino-4-deoxy-L-arabinose transferase-like glycosyltransferase
VNQTSQNSSSGNSSGALILIAALVAVLITRLTTLGIPDLVDTTEGRYATIAKLMLERDDWVTPWLIYKGQAEPYLGKPPLHFWLIETSYLIFGLGNASARLPGVISGAATCVVVAVFGSALFSLEAGLVAALVLATSTLFFFLSGAVVLDVTLTFGITLALASFALADRRKVWGYLFFVGLGIGVLVKGPLAIVLAGLTIAPWALLRRYVSGAWPAQLSHLPFITGSGILICLVVPWYLWAESRNKGFLEYFLITENYERFTNPDYGDKYGTGHVQPPGTAWLMMIPALFPWILIVLGMGYHFFKRVTHGGGIKEWANDPWVSFFALWTLGTPALLTFATQYTGTYLVPVLPGFALLAALTWYRWNSQLRADQELGRQALFAVTVFLSLVVVVGSIIALWFEGTATDSLSAFAIGLGMLAFATIDGFRNRTAAGLISCVAVYTAIAYSLSAVCFNNYISNSRSTNRILTLAARVAPATSSSITVGFRGDLPFSASFYPNLINEKKIEVKGVREQEIASAAIDFLAVRKGGVEAVAKAMPHAKLRGHTGKWFLYDMGRQPVKDIRLEIKGESH